jgi:osmotically inducible protein OsmC
MPLDKPLYSAKTHTIGGCDGASHADDGHLAVTPSSPGTPGSGTNPEQPRNRTGVRGPRA